MTRRPLPKPDPLDRGAKIILAILAIFWATAILAGGSARADVLGVSAVRVLAVMAIGILLLVVPRGELKFDRQMLIFAAICAAVVALQLVPLPPSIWLSLPGRQAYDMSYVPEMKSVWRPISLVPDLTWNSLLSLIPPLVFVIAVPLLGARLQRWLLLGLLSTILLSGFLGLLQIADGSDSLLRWYRITDAGSATGFFANRNHDAAFLAMGIPLATWWALTSQVGGRFAVRLAIAGCVTAFLLVAVVTSQSRAGFVVALVAIVISMAMVVREGKLSRVGLSALVASVCILLAVGGWLALNPQGRMAQLEVGTDQRVKMFPQTIEAGKAFFPVGSGFGTFAPVFRRFERAENLSPRYFNHSHIEPTNLLVEGGLVALLLLAALVAWFVVAGFQAWRPRGKNGGGGSAVQARLCTALLFLPLIASASDYPLRTPIHACAFAMAAALLRQSLRVVRKRASN